MEVHQAFRDSLVSNRRPELLFPVAVATAACDMSHILARPCYSLTQFVEFGTGHLEDEETSVDDVHLLIFQKHCLAYSNKDQLRFHVRSTALDCERHKITATAQILPPSGAEFLKRNCFLIKIQIYG